MSVECTNATADRVEFGDIATDGLTAVTLAITILLNAAPATGRNISGKSNAWPDQAFTMTVQDNNEIGFGVEDDINRLFARITSGVNLVSGSLYRILCTWTNVGGQAIEIWVNGVLEPDVAWFGGVPNALRTTVAPFSFGHRGYAANNAMGGDYSEVAVWDHVVPQWFKEAYGKGLSPRFYRKGGILYCPAWNTGHLIDQWGRVDGTNSGGANAAHPRMYYPALSPSRFGFPPPPAVAPHIDDATISIKPLQGAAISVGAGAATISVKRSEDKVI